MRNHVSKVLIGTADANVATVDDLGPATVPVGNIIAYDFDTNGSIVATTKNIGFAKGTAVLGEPIIAGPIPKAGITDAILNPYKAAVNKVMTLTCTAVPTVGKTIIAKVVYHDNLSIVPNQIKQTAVSITADAANTASVTAWATALTAEFNKQVNGNLFVTVASAVGVITFTGITLITASNYNGIDRPEVLNFEVGITDYEGHGTHAVATTVALAPGQGDAAKVAWVEDLAQGRQGFSDRRLWNDTKKYQSQVVAGETYDNLVITANIAVEGDMQGVRQNPIGVILFGDSDTLAPIITDLATCGIVPVTVAAG